MFRSLMTFIREIYLDPTRVIFTLEHSSKLRRYIQIIHKKKCTVSKVNKKFISYLTQGTTYTVSSGNCPSFSCATSSLLLMLIAGPRGQFPRWRRSRKRLSVCSLLRYPDLWLQCSVSFVHCNHRSGYLKREHTESLFLLRRHLGNWPLGPAISMRSELLVAHEKLGQSPLLTVYVVPVLGEK